MQELLHHLRKVVTKNNTEIEAYCESIHFTLHNTDIVVWNLESGVISVRNGGYYTCTTKNRINEILGSLKIPFFVHQYRHKWYISSHNDPKNQSFETVNVFKKENKQVIANKHQYWGDILDFSNNPPTVIESEWSKKYKANSTVHLRLNVWLMLLTEYNTP